MRRYICETLKRFRDGRWWELLLFDFLVALFSVALVVIPAFALRQFATIALSTVLLASLFIVHLFTRKGKPRIAILAAVVSCFAFDFFLTEPSLSFTIYNMEQGIDLFLFLLLAIMWTYSYSQQIRQNAKRLTSYEERLRKQNEEANRRDYELHTFYDVMEVTRDEKDLKLQLSQLAQAITDAFTFCGFRGCSFYFSDLDSEGNTSMWELSSQRGNFPKLATGDETSVMWIMKNGKSLTLPEIPLVSHAKGSYLRRVVGSNRSSSQSIYYCNYLVPLISGQKPLGVMRLYIEDDGNPELLAIRAFLEKGTLPSSTHSELFSQLYKHAVSMIEQALIERALMLEESLRSELQKRTEDMRTAIISSVSHDFRTPLTHIMGVASGLLNMPQSWEDKMAWRDSLRAIVSETERIERIVTKMLALSRIEHGTFTLKRELYPIETIILNTLDQSHMRSLKQGRDIKLLVPDDIPPVELDPDLIGQVFTNLIENAIRYTPANSPIEIAVQADEEQMYVSVADRGSGIPANELEQVFERFHRVKQVVLDDEAPVTDQGSGLGLAVCRGFVRAHGGKIWAGNRKFGGARFTFTLPFHATAGVIYEKDTAHRGSGSLGA